MRENYITRCKLLPDCHLALGDAIGVFIVLLQKVKESDR